MHIVTKITPTSNPKSIVESLNFEKGLPLSEVLSPESINSSLSDMPCRKRDGISPPENVISDLTYERAKLMEDRFRKVGYGASSKTG